MPSNWSDEMDDWVHNYIDRPSTVQQLRRHADAPEDRQQGQEPTGHSAVFERQAGK